MKHNWLKKFKETFTQLWGDNLIRKKRRECRIFFKERVLKKLLAPFMKYAEYLMALPGAILVLVSPFMIFLPSYFYIYAAFVCLGFGIAQVYVAYKALKLKRVLEATLKQVQATVVIQNVVPNEDRSLSAMVPNLDKVTLH